MDGPAVSIDYGRPFSLPFGLAPTTDASYIARLDVETGYAMYPRQPGPLRWPPERGEVAAIPFSGVPNNFAILPASTTSGLGVATTRLAPAPTNVFRWDAVAAKTGPFPLPAYDDGALVMRWRPRAATQFAGSLTNGVLEDDEADYLLATHATGGSEEAARDLLRTPLVGLVRFERYRHLVWDGVALNVGPSRSTTGAIVIRSRAGGATPPRGHPPVLGSCLVILENVDREHAVSCLGRLAWSSLVHRDEVQAQVALRGDGATAEGVLVQAYLDYVHVVHATHRPTVPDPLALLPPLLREPFEGRAPKPQVRHSGAVIELCLLTTTLRASLLDFVITVFAEIVAGATWSDIGVTTIDGATTPPDALTDAHARLKALPSSTQTWLPCFAGAPVGRAASVVVADGDNPTASTAAQGSLSPFHLEALDAAQRSAPQATAFGSLAALRVIDDGADESLLTTRDFLDAIVKGSNGKTSFPAPLDLDGLAGLGHPYAKAVDWARFVQARAARSNLDILRRHTTKPKGPSLAAASLKFWKDRTGLIVNDQWPAVIVGVGEAEVAPTPAAPYASRATLPSPFGGFDEYDLEAVLRARSVVRDGRSAQTDIPVPLFLALLDREGYRALGAYSRTPVRIDTPDIGAYDLRAYTLANWLDKTFGLDLLTHGSVLVPTGPSLTGHPLRDFPPPRFNTSFPSIHAELVRLGLLAADLEPLLNEADCLDYLELRRPGKRLGPNGISMVLRSRSAQWMGIALQMATFQWIHRQLSIATIDRHETPTPVDAWVRADEYQADPPMVGANANSDERRRFIGYWSLVYLALNTSPPTWNRWVRSVPDANITASTSLSVFLTDRKNTQERVVEPGPAVLPRRIGQRGNMVRFAAGLDAYMRLGVNADGADRVDPAARTWPAR